MRAWLLALGLVLAPATAMAQPVQPGAALRQMGVWAQKLVAIQQPAIDSYQRCAPIIQQVTTVLQSPVATRREAASRTLAPMRQCLADMRAAMTTVRDGFARMEPMPGTFEQMLHVDSKDMLAKSATASEGMATYLEQTEAALEAVAAGDEALAMRRIGEARAGAGSIIDAQILLLETLQSSMPLETHKAMFDVRLVMYRGMRAIIVSDPGSQSAELTANLRALGAASRLAASRLRASWKGDSGGLRRAVAQLNNPSRTAMLASMDQAFETVAASGDEVAAMLEPLPPGQLAPGKALQILNQFAVLETRTLEAIRAMSVAATQVQ